MDRITVEEMLYLFHRSSADARGLSYADAEEYLAIRGVEEARKRLPRRVRIWILSGPGAEAWLQLGLVDKIRWHPLHSRGGRSKRTAVQ